MKSLTRVLVGLLLVLVLGAAVFLATWDIPPPTAPVEKVLPDDRFPN